MKTDQELKQTYKLSLAESGIVNLLFLNEETDSENNTRQTELLLDGLTKIISKNPQKRYSMLVDTTPVKSANFVSDRSKELYSNSPVFRDLLKIAVVSKSLLLKVLVFTISLATGKADNVKWFEEKEQGLQWLKE